MKVKVTKDQKSKFIKKKQQPIFMTRYSTFSVTSPSEENFNFYNFQLHVRVQLGINLPSDSLLYIWLGSVSKIFFNQTPYPSDIHVIRIMSKYSYTCIIFVCSSVCLFVWFFLHGLVYSLHFSPTTYKDTH